MSKQGVVSSNYPSHSPDYRRRYRKANRERINAYKRSRYPLEKAAISARAKRYYQANKETIKSRVARYQKDNYVYCLQRKLQYRKAHRKELATAELSRHNTKKHLPDYAVKRAAYREKIRPKMRQWTRERSKNVTDGYARELLSKYSAVSAKDWQQDLVEVKRLELKIRRLTGDRRYKQP